MAGTKTRKGWSDSKVIPRQYESLVAQLQAEADEMKARCGRRPRYIYMRPEAARGLVVIAGMVVRECPDLPPGEAVLSAELGKQAGTRGPRLAVGLRAQAGVTA